MVIELIETHAHIYLPEFDNDRGDIIEKAKSQGINKMYMPAIDSTTHQQMLEVETQFNVCHSMIGLHPCSVKENYLEELSIVEQFLKKRSFCAIGEIGLDFYWDKTFTDQQYYCFEKQAQWAIDYELPIVIHSRNALDECIEVVKKFKGIRGVFHCFSGTVQQATEIIKAGFFLGIGGVITYKNAGLDAVIAQIGIDKLVLETDAPYLAPVPYRGKRNESSYLPLIAQKVSVVTGKSLEDVATITTKNASILFSSGS
jgi:TatD DNase family protein